MDCPRAPGTESVGRGGAPDSRCLLRLLRDRRGEARSAFGMMAGAIAFAFVGGLLFAGRYGGDVYHDVIRTFERTLGL